jgi:hypothetical protein
MIEYKIMVIDTFDLMHKLYIHVKYTIDYCAISHKEKKKEKKKEPLAYGSGQWKGCIICLPRARNNISKEAD